jgi:nucleoside-diphosphate-sugar epimerase
MRVLFIGGTRFIGLAAVNHLAQSGHTVTIFHRGQTEANLPEGVTEILGDMTQIEDFAEEFKRAAPDVVVHMMLVQERDAIRTMNLFKGLASRVVGISSADVYMAYGRINGTEPGEPVEVPLHEDSPLRQEWYPYRATTGNDPEHRLYNYDKIPIEQTLMSDQDLPGTVLRLPMVYGPRDYQRRLYPYLKRMDDKRPAIPITHEFAAWRNTRGYVEDTGAAIALAVTDARAAGRIYNVAEPDPLTETEWIRAIGEVVGWNGDIVPVDAEKLPNAFSVHGQDLVMDTTRIRTELGFAEDIPRAEAIRRTIEWDRTNPPEELSPEADDYQAEDQILDQLQG